MAAYIPVPRDLTRVKSKAVSYTHLERLTDDDVMLLLTLIFHRQDTQELLKKLLEREKPETP